MSLWLSPCYALLLTCFPLHVPKRSSQLQSFLHSCLGPCLLTNLPKILWLWEFYILSKMKQTKSLASAIPASFSSVSPSAFFFHSTSKLSRSKRGHVASSVLAFICFFKGVALLIAGLSLPMKKAASYWIHLFLCVFSNCFTFSCPNWARRNRSILGLDML